jgi:integrase
MAKRLTAIGVDSIKAKDHRVEIADATPGLYLIVQPSGHKSWAVRYRLASRPQKLTLPPGTSLAQARILASEARAKAEAGTDPAQEKRAARAATEIEEGRTLRAAVESYLRFEESRPEGDRLRSITERRRVFERAILPALGNRPIMELKRSEVVKMLDTVMVERGPRAADMALSVLRTFFNWYTIREDSFRTPLAPRMGYVKPKDRQRERTLSDDELCRIWAASDKVRVPFGNLVRLLLLTACRRCEVSDMTWSEINGDTWVIAAARYKGQRAHTVPLSKAAQQIIANQPRIQGCQYVFTLGSKPFSAFGRAKRQLDAISGTNGWTLHDLRRTARTLLSRAGINADVAERCLGHEIGGVRGVYDRHRYEQEKRHAFEMLAQQVDLIVNPPSGDVIPLRR